MTVHYLSIKRADCFFLFVIRFSGRMVYFANIVPLQLFKDASRSYSRMQVEKLLRTTNKKRTKQNKETVYQGQVILQLGNDLWLRNIELVESLSVIDTTVSLLNVKQELLKQHFAEYKEECLKKLLALCQDVGIEIENKIEVNVVKEKKQKRKQAVPQWAFLDETIDYNEVYFSAGNSPNEFYVRLKKFQKQ